MSNLKKLLSALFMFVLALSCSHLEANKKVRIAVLDFELKDLTIIPSTQAEFERTARIRPMLESELKKMGYAVVAIRSSDIDKANAGIGYLFDHHDDAAKLARKYDADYVVVGRLHKPSYLFVYLMAHLINVKSSKLIGDFISEVKGGEKKLMLKGVESLAVKIDDLIGH